MTRIQILLNQDTRESFLHGYREGHRLMRVFDRSWPVTTPENKTLLLESCFKRNQHLDDQRPLYEGRSLSKGDVIVVDDEAYAIESVGFRKVEVPS